MQRKDDVRLSYGKEVSHYSIPIEDNYYHHAFRRTSIQTGGLQGRQMKHGEKGYTLVELLVAITIMAVASVAAGACIFQIIRNTEGNSNHMAAVLQVQNAEQRISQDVQRAQRVTTDNLTLPNLLVLSWIDGSSGEEHQVTYTLEDMPGSTLKELRRNQSVNGTDNITSLVARQIDSDPEKTRCELTNGILILTMTANIGNGATMESETRTYRILPRPG